MTISNENERFTFVIDKDIKAKLQILADSQKRKLGNYIAQTLEKHVIDFELEILETYGYSGFHEAHNSIFPNQRITLFEGELDQEQKERLNEAKLEYETDSAIDEDNITPEFRQFLFRNKISISKNS